MRLIWSYVASRANTEGGELRLSSMSHIKRAGSLVDMKSQLAALYVTLGSDDVDVDEAARGRARPFYAEWPLEKHL